MIEYAGNKDIDRIYGIMQESERIAYTKELVNDLITSPDSFCLKLEEEGKLIGALGARAEGENSCWLYFIVIRKESRGRGYARELMERFFREAGRKGIKRIALDTPDREFFEKFGFEDVGKIPKWYETEDQHIMFKSLN